MQHCEHASLWGGGEVVVSGGGVMGSESVGPGDRNLPSIRPSACAWVPPHTSGAAMPLPGRGAGPKALKMPCQLNASFIAEVSSARAQIYSKKSVQAPVPMSQCQTSSVQCSL